MDPRMHAIEVKQKTIEALVKRPHPKQTEYRDKLTTGLRFRIGPRGAVWYYMRRIDGKVTRLRLGGWPRMGIKAARDAVATIESDIAEGKHPKTEQARKRAEKADSRRADQKRIIKTLAADFSAHHFPTLAESTKRDYSSLLNEFVQTFGDRGAATVKRGEIIRHLDKVKARSGAQANRSATVIRQLFEHALDRYDLPTNPARDIKTPAKPKARKRTLDRREISALWQACELVGYPYGPALQIALCTGQRIGEIGSMRWDDIKDNYWTNAVNKTDQRIDIYLADHARAILDHCPAIGDYVFTNTGKHGIRSDTWGGVTGALSRYFKPLLEDMEHFTPHDLRRTVRTGLTGWAGVLPDTAERVLNHSISGLRAHYDFADYRPHVAQALEAWDNELGRIIEGEQSSVMPIKGVA